METLEPVIGKTYARGCGLRIRRWDEIPESEFEVQAMLYAKLLAAGVDVRGEVVVVNNVHEFGAKPTFRKSDRAKCRFDLVIFEGGEAVHIVETKARPKQFAKKATEETRQGKRYTAFGIPVTFVYGRHEASAFVDQWLSERGRDA